MISNMNPRQFKKLCAKCHFLVILAEPSWAGCSIAVGERGNDGIGWHPGDALRGTKGFGGMSGYYEPEWWDQSAWSALVEIVFWHFAEYKDGRADLDDPYPDWPEGMRPTRWQDYLQLAERMVRDREEGGA